MCHPEHSVVCVGVVYALQETDMKRLMIGLTAVALLTSPVAMAQPDNQRGPRYESHERAENHDRGDRYDRGDRHDRGDRRWQQQNARRDNGRHRGWGRDRGHNARWGRGQQMGYNDWRYAQRIDYRRYNLRQPPRGYEWRRNNDRYILAAVASGMIISVILVNHR